jgi:hypothetical protein
MRADGIGRPPASAADGDERRVPTLAVRLAAVRSALAEVSDAQGAALLAAALRSSPRVLFVGEGGAAATVLSPQGGGVVPCYALEARLTGIGTPQAKPRRRVDAVVIDLTAWDWSEAQAIDSLTVLRRVAAVSWSGHDAASLRGAVGAAVEDAVRQLMPRLDGEGR